MDIPPIETIKLDNNNFDAISFIKEYLNGCICHFTSQKNFEGIIKEKIIHPSNPDYGSKMFKYCSMGYNQKCVCLCDFRNLNRDETFLNTVSKCLSYNYIFLLKGSEYKNIINPKTEEEIKKNRDTEYGVPLYECWYKGDLSLDKIDKILNLEWYNVNYQDEKIVAEITRFLEE